MKFLISIPVHEKPEVIYDQIINIQKLVPNSGIVLHVNLKYFEKHNLSFIQHFDNVWINPTHLDVWWGNIIFTHISNFNYMYDKVDFDYFIMHSSNDLYVKPGVEQYIIQYDAGFVEHQVRYKYTMWWPSFEAWGDPWLNEIQSSIGQNRIFASQIEGSFYKRELMKKIVDVILYTGEHFSNIEKNRAIAREEIFFPTIAKSFISTRTIGKPVVFSEVHRFDRLLWSKLDKRNKNYNRFFKKIIPEVYFNRRTKKINDKLFESKFYRTTTDIVDKIRFEDLGYIESNSYLDEGSGQFKLYDPQGLFAVKRVNREYFDTVREYIRKQVTNK